MYSEVLEISSQASLVAIILSTKGRIVFMHFSNIFLSLKTMLYLEQHHSVLGMVILILGDGD